MLASLNGHVKIVQMLIKAKANVDAETERGNTALIWASYNGHVDIVKMLIKAGADVDAKTKDGGYTALMYAYRKRRIEIIYVLLEAGAKVTQSDRDAIMQLLPSLPSSDRVVLLHYINNPIEPPSSYTVAMNDEDQRTRKYMVNECKDLGLESKPDYACLKRLNLLGLQNAFPSSVNIVKEIAGIIHGYSGNDYNHYFKKVEQSDIDIDEKSREDKENSDISSSF
jgi:ankyrin repeat protein